MFAAVPAYEEFLLEDQLPALQTPLFYPSSSPTNSPSATPTVSISTQYIQELYSVGSYYEAYEYLLPLGRYFLIPVYDLFTEVLGEVAVKFAITPPGWSGTLPPELLEIKATTFYVLLVARTYTTGTPEDLALVVDPNVPTNGIAQAVALTPPQLLAYAAELLKIRIRQLDYPPPEAHRHHSRPELQLGGPGPSLAVHREWLVVCRQLRQLLPAVSISGLWGNAVEDSIYPGNLYDNLGVPLDAKYSYSITFSAKAPPPVNAFWSITLYNSATNTGIYNPYNRYRLSAADNLAYNPDGSFTIYIPQAQPSRPLLGLASGAIRLSTGRSSRCLLARGSHRLSLESLGFEFDFPDLVGIQCVAVVSKAKQSKAECKSDIYTSVCVSSVGT
eukprot:gene27025-35732_t